MCVFCQLVPEYYCLRCTHDLAGSGMQQQQAGLGAARRLAVADHGQQAWLMGETLVHGPDVMLVADIATPEVRVRGARGAMALEVFHDDLQGCFLLLMLAAASWVRFQR